MPQCTEEKSSDDRTARNDLRNGAGAFARYRPEPRGDRRMDIGRRNHPRHRGSRSPHARNGPATSIGRAKCATAARVARSSRRPDRGPRRPMEYCCRQQPRPKLPQRRSTSSCRNPIVSMNPGQQCRMKGGRSGKSKHPAWLSKGGRIFLIVQPRGYTQVTGVASGNISTIVFVIAFTIRTLSFMATYL